RRPPSTAGVSPWIGVNRANPRRKFRSPILREFRGPRPSNPHIIFCRAQSTFLPETGRARSMDTLFGIVTSFLIGIGMAASCGFRVFVPMLVMSLAVRAGLLHLSEGWHWMGSWPALVAFSVASVAEIIGFYIPWIDHLLDAVAVPAAVIAGTIATAAC